MRPLLLAAVLILPVELPAEAGCFLFFCNTYYHGHHPRHKHHKAHVMVVHRVVVKKKVIVEKKVIIEKRRPRWQPPIVW